MSVYTIMRRLNQSLSKVTPRRSALGCCLMREGQLIALGFQSPDSYETKLCTNREGMSQALSLAEPTARYVAQRRMRRAGAGIRTREECHGDTQSEGRTKALSGSLQTHLSECTCHTFSMRWVRVFKGQAP